ncbi:acyltransferase family protein [Devosia epidermidihirudinis]|uniref:acyltransferase family protein n=1 Tax=Devosia epidermidihirudinis TaxID=1293439 RepID=UPI0009E2B39B|nr:acyltransferase [Devosia epidermidihirudinis]
MSGNGLTQSAPARLDEITSARGIAACVVVLYHINAYANGAIAGAFPPLHYGILAVDFFFVLSGFILTHVYRDAWRAGTYRHGSFMGKRFARVWPLHAATLIGVALIVLAGARFGLSPEWHPTISSFILNALMLDAEGLTPELAWNQPAWSIGAEWFAYLLFPIFLIVIDRLGNNSLRAVACVVVFLVCAAASTALFHVDLMELTYQGGVLRIIPSFLAGVALRYAFDGALARGWGGNGPLIDGGLLAGLILMVAAGYFGLPNAAFWPIIIAILFLLALRAHSQTPTPLRYPALVWLGDISYAIYLVHAPVLMLVYGVGGKLLNADSTPALLGLGALAFIISIISGWLAHVLIERPSQSWLVGLVGGRPKPVAAE